MKQDFIQSLVSNVSPRSPLFSPPPPRASVSVTGENREKNLGVFFQGIIKDFHYIVKGGQSQVKQKT